MKRFVPLLLPALLLATSLFQGCGISDSRADEPAGEQGEASEASSADSDAPQGEAQDGTSRDAAGDAEPAVPVEVATLGRGAIESVLRFSTNLEAERQVEVYSETSRRVVERFVEEGSQVAKGDLLLRLQDDEQKTRLAKVKTEYDKALREYQRQQRLFEGSLISEQAMNDSTYEVERLELEVEEAERALSYTEVRAPIAGTVTRRLVNVGDYVTPNQHLFDLVDFGSIVARVFVPEKELARLDPGQKARIISPAVPGRDFEGRVARISPVVDPASGTVKVTVDLPRSRGLRPGMYVDVALVTELREDALLLPKRALVYDADQIFAFRLEEKDGETRARRVGVQPLLDDQQWVEVDAGFSEGDAVVIAGQTGLKDGTVVRRVDAASLSADTPGEATRGE